MLEVMINDQVVKIENIAADTMLLNYLREELTLTGTKEGCASGDCGACTVVLVEKDETNALRFKQINSCITPIHALHGKQIITVEHLKQGNTLHPVQQAVVDRHGSQCGFCTPGFVMSLYALSKQKEKPEHPQDYLGGNLCRCTGYGPLIEAANDVCGVEYYDPLSESEAETLNWIESVPALDAPNYMVPTSREEMAQCLASNKEAKIIAGGTDLALEVTQRLLSLPALIDVCHIADMTNIEQLANGWRLGAAVPISDVHQFLNKHFPTANELIDRLGSKTIRHRATLGGSLGHASPIGDIAPLLMSLNAQIEVDDGIEKSFYTPDDFITGYRSTILNDKQWISAVLLPKLEPNQRHAIYKVSKRFEDDISTVVLGINLNFDNDIIASAVFAAGGVAAKTVRISELEQACVGQVFDKTLVSKLQAIVETAIKPLSDARASSSYRVTLIKNLIQRFYLEQQQIETRLTYHA